MTAYTHPTSRALDCFVRSIRGDARLRRPVPDAATLHLATAGTVALASRVLQGARLCSVEQLPRDGALSRVSENVASVKGVFSKGVWVPNGL